MRVVADSHAIVWYVQGSKRLSERAGEVLAEAEAERSLVVSVATLADATTSIPRASVPDPWDRLIMATAIALQAPLVTRDSAIRASGLVQTIW